MTFVCQCCGDCCSTMGEIISIQEQIGTYIFRIGYIDGEERIVTVDSDKRELFCDQQQEDKKTIACPFLRQRAHIPICTVHASRPELCRNYLCSRILILNKDGEKAGRVPQGTRSFTTEDRTLLDLWSCTLRDTRIPDDELWEKNVEDVFTRAGYRVIR
ncbi:MAG: YkgJ family cysteine cluster protein [Methanoregulaceae archaeon]|nr:MAG: YkgJ family cysteine cluster protein [Methanoregulaceae archaeon]